MIIKRFFVVQEIFVGGSSCNFAFLQQLIFDLNVLVQTFRELLTYKEMLIADNSRLVWRKNKTILQGTCSGNK